ncbi:zinc-binding metallopeptidase family protein [Caldinitratiruptor microaerophilus]|uniref:Aminopeptidase n=1 Tax=Caldinitratiruptor microaerophilus TaxID=671077 RepID=A0AA35CIW0_9FIRM|nr:hypothetical protein [Caldinitratiruptor microaerophilus]BDG59153.1 aminopeptidase [Caldinitratiruptor microaerophilus]
MKDLLGQLSGLWGPPGREEAVAKALADLVRPHVDEVRTDALGNVLAVRRAGSAPARRLLLLAGMDGPGGVVLDGTAEGYLRFAPVGGLSLVAARGQRVRFADGTAGVVGGEPVEDPKDLKVQNSWIDIGARDRDDALARVAPGSFFALDQPLTAIGDWVAGPNLAGRAGCAVLVALAGRLARNPGHRNEVHLAFTVQGTVAPRGARTAAFQVQPDLAVVVTAAPDEPGAGRARVGQGPVLRLREAGWVLRAPARRELEEAARTAGVRWQPEVAEKGASDAPGAEAAAGGVPVAVAGYPVRYRGTPAEVVAPADLEALVDWLAALATGTAGAAASAAASA